MYMYEYVPYDLPKCRVPYRYVYRSEYSCTGTVPYRTYRGFRANYTMF
jgi:hypothetical protein